MTNSKIMVLPKSSVSSQYLKESLISVTVIEMKSPAHFVIKESPSVNTSSEAKKFVEAEEMMQKYYHSTEPTFFQLPLKNAIVVVCKERKFYRAQVRSILTTSEGHLIKVYLLDYGIHCTIPRNCVFQIQQDFLLHPFQAVEFKLLNVVPISLVLNSENFSMEYGIVDAWDVSAITFVEKLREGMIDAHIKVRGVGPDFLAGSLYMTFADNEMKCINDELTLKKYAQDNTDCWNNVTKISDILSKLPVHHSSVLKGSFAPTSSISSSSETSPSSAVMKSVLSKLTGQHTNVLQRNIPPTSSPNSSSEMSPVSPFFSKLPGQQTNLSQDYTTPTSSPKKSSQVSPKSLGASPNFHRQHKNELHRAPSPSNQTQGSPNSLVKEMQTKPNDSVSRLQNLLKLRSNRESIASQKSPIKEYMKEPENVKDEKVETENKSISESEGSSCSENNYNKIQLKTLLNYHSLMSSKSAVYRKEHPGLHSLEAVEKFKLYPTSPPSSTSSDTCDTSASNLRTPVRNVNVSESSEKQSNSSLQNSKHKLTSPRLKIALEGPINRHSVEGVKPNLSSEYVTKIPTDPLSTEEASLLKSPKTSVKFSNIKNFLYRKRNSPSSAPPVLDTDTAKDNESISEMKKETIICQDLLTEDKKDSDAIASPESKVKQDLSDSLNLDDMVFADEDDFLQCALDPKIDRSSPTSLSKSPSTSSCSESFRDIKIDFSDKSLWEKQRVPALCLGNAVPKPVLSTSAMSFPPELQKVLDDVNFCGPSCIQSVVWPSVQRGRSLAAISPPHSGKTVAYLLPIVSNFVLGTSYADLPNENGPIAIIICSTWKKVQAVYDLFYIFLQGIKKVRILTFFVDGRSKKHKIATLLNGCDIAITVPSCLLEFFKEHVMSLNRCLHFILDDGSNLLTYCMDEMKQIMSYFILEAKKAALKNLEIIICAERWTKSVASFVDKFMVSPLLLFTSFLEAAIYAKVPMYPHLCEESDKRLKLLEILEKTKRTIICTTSSEIASDIHSFLQYENIRSYLINETQEHYISEEIIQDWKSVKSSAVPHCLIVTDAALSSMSISNANYLIHYDVPEVSRLQFGN